MIEMNFKDGVRTGLSVTPKQLTEDAEKNEYPTGLYAIRSRDGEYNSSDNILYFGYGVWVRNQETCNAAGYRVTYVGPVEIEVNLVNKN